MNKTSFCCLCKFPPFATLQLAGFVLCKCLATLLLGVVQKNVWKVTVSFAPGFNILHVNSSVFPQSTPQTMINNLCSKFKCPLRLFYAVEMYASFQYSNDKDCDRACASICRTTNKFNTFFLETKNSIWSIANSNSSICETRHPFFHEIFVAIFTCIMVN